MHHPAPTTTSVDMPTTAATTTAAKEQGTYLNRSTTTTTATITTCDASKHHRGNNAAAVLPPAPPTAFVSRGGRPVFAAPPSGAVPVRIPTESSATAGQANGGAAMAVPPGLRRRSQIQIIVRNPVVCNPRKNNNATTTMAAKQTNATSTVIPAAQRQHPPPQQQKSDKNSNSNHPFEDCFAPRNTWPRHGVNGFYTHDRHATGPAAANDTTPTRLTTTNKPTRSPLSFYSDGALRSFAVCGAPGCDVCTNNGTAYMGGGAVGGDSRLHGNGALHSAGGRVHSRSFDDLGSSRRGAAAAAAAAQRRPTGLNFFDEH
ncbi:unnamed protein product, partial [Sphacelaria rigidula]